MDIDAIDRKIIDQLRIDGRASFAVIGRYVGLSEASVRARYGRLAKAGIVQVVGMSDAPKIGEIEVHLAIRIRGASAAAVTKQLVSFPEIKYIATAVGAYDLILDVRCSGGEHLSKLLNDGIRRVHGVHDIDTLTVLEVLKDSYLWAGFRETAPASNRPVIIRERAGRYSS